jgi:integrase
VALCRRSASATSARLTKPADVAALIRAIDGYQGSLIERCALKFSALTFARPGEIRKAEWSEIDFDNALWRIPAERMKAGREHLVPLARRAIAILRELHPLTGAGKYLFTGRTPGRPMSENAIGAELCYLGYERRRMTAQGFRRMASTLLNESGKWSPDAIERELAHAEGDEVRAAYNAAEHLQERVRMMRWWADLRRRLPIVVERIARVLRVWIAKGRVLQLQLGHMAPDTSDLVE